MCAGDDALRRGGRGLAKLIAYCAAVVEACVLQLVSAAEDMCRLSLMKLVRGQSDFAFFRSCGISCRKFSSLMPTTMPTLQILYVLHIRFVGDGESTAPSRSTQKCDRHYGYGVGAIG